VQTGSTPVVTGRDGVRALDLASKITDQVDLISDKVINGGM
jgi:hypothetical protein